MSLDKPQLLIEPDMVIKAHKKRNSPPCSPTSSIRGAEVYLKPAKNYVKLGRPVNFYTVVEAARRRGKIAIGYRREALAKDASQAYGVAREPGQVGEGNVRGGGSDHRSGGGV